MSDELAKFVQLAPLGFAIGLYGTLVGAGGGSLLVPALLLLMPGKEPATITAMSMAVVFFNAYSGTFQYIRMGRVDFRSGVLFTLASVPGAAVGALMVHELPRKVFEPVLGIVVLALGSFLVASPVRKTLTTPSSGVEQGPSLRLGAIGSSYIALISSLLGLGGGVMHVPFLIRVLRYPAHVATATSHFVLTFAALTATLMHVAAGEFDQGVAETMYLAVGVMMGAPVGASLSAKIRGPVIVRLLALALVLVGLRLLARSIT